MKWILKYLRGSVYVGIKFRASSCSVSSFVNSDFAGDLDQVRLTTGYFFCMYGCAISWKATLKHIVALSTIEASYIAATKVVKEALWLRGLICDLEIDQKKMMVC